MAPIRLKSVVYPTSAMAEAISFYRDVLGLPLQFQDGVEWAQFKPEGGSFALAGPREQPPEPAGPVMTLEVESLDAIRPRLLAAGVRVIGERDMATHGRSLTIADPGGNLVHLFEK